MPFYMEKPKGNGIAHTMIKSTILTLQVRIQATPKSVASALIYGHGKKAFLSVSASLTLEASLALTLFIFAVIIMILPMKIINTDRKMQAGLESIGEEFSRYAHLQQALEQGAVLAVPGASNFAKEFCDHLKGGAAVGYAQLRIGEYVDSPAVQALRMIRSSPMEDGAWFDLVLDYQIQMPFPVMGMNHVNRSLRSRRRAWIGKAGKEYGTAGGGEGTETKDPLVYIGRDSTRYHESRTCHYLANQLTAVTYQAIEDCRNDSGGRYHPCAVCGGAGTSGEMVYIMPSGNRYHTRKACRAIVAYIQAVRLSQVEHLGPCSYCSR